MGNKFCTIYRVHGFNKSWIFVIIVLLIICVTFAIAWFLIFPQRTSSTITTTITTPIFTTSLERKICEQYLSSTTSVSQEPIISEDLDSYARFGILEEMLKDEIKTLNYRNAIYDNQHFFKDKIVLNIGSGTGLFAMFAAKAGAKIVIGIELSNTALHSIQNIKDNHLDHIITIVQGKVEEIEKLPFNIEKIDVIVSEWMGYSLFYKSKLDAVIYARDKWLKPITGVIYPDKASMYISAIESRPYKDNYYWWENFYGFNISSIRKAAISEPLIDVVDPNQVVTNAALIKEIDLYTVRTDDLTWESPFSLTCQRNDYVHALVTYFSVEFTKCHLRTGFSTAPEQRYTLWKQTVFYLKGSLPVKRGEDINGFFAIQPKERKNHGFDLQISISFHGEFCNLEEANSYYMR